MSYSIEINGVDRTTSVIAGTLKITDSSGQVASSMVFNFENLDGLDNPIPDDVVVVNYNGDKLFGGHIIDTTPRRLGTGKTGISINCVDFTRVLDRRLVVETYENMTDKEIIEHIITNYCNTEAITTNSVIEGVTIDQIQFSYMPVSQCLNKITKLTGRTWYLDYNKNLHYFPTTTNAAPFDITDSGADHKNLKVKLSNAQIRNRVFVRGGIKLSDPFTEDQVADGEQIVFLLANKPHDLSMTVNSVSKTIGILNIDDPADFDFLLNFQQQFVVTGSAPTPTAGDVLSFTYSYEIPILVAVEDTDSINEIGQFEYLIIDNTITTTEQARARAQAELTDYANSVVSGSFTTVVDGFRAGQYMNINVTELGINDDYLVQSVVAKSFGNGFFEYEIKIASAQVLGLIQFLIGMLEQSKNNVRISTDEVVDALFTIPNESITPSDSIISTDLTSPPFQYDAASYDFAEYS